MTGIIGCIIDCPCGCCGAGGGAPTFVGMDIIRVYSLGPC
jgi:hypothetical protein